jgi:hypothetical protein
MRKSGTWTLTLLLRKPQPSAKLFLSASREACAERHRIKEGRKPLFRSLRFVWRLFVVFGFAIEEADRIGDALDNGLLDGDFDGFVLVGSFDFAVVGIGVKPALDKNVFAFEKAVGQFGKSFSVPNNLAPFGGLLPFAIGGFPGFFGGDGELGHLTAGLESFGFAIASNKTNECKLIEIHK